MQNIIRWIVPPRKRAIGMINAGIGVFCESHGFSRDEISRLQVSVEGVFGYCVGNILAAKGAEEIAVWMLRDKERIKIVFQHYGAGGEWDHVLRPDAADHVRRTSFEAMGLFIAEEMADSLVHDSQLDLASGHTMKTYELQYIQKDSKNSHQS